MFRHSCPRKLPFRPNYDSVQLGNKLDIDQIDNQTPTPDATACKLTSWLTTACVSRFGLV